MFITENAQTKLKENLGVAATRAAIKKSLKVSGLEYIDLYLVHGPLGGLKAREDSWTACVEAQKEGIVKSIGVSNFGLRHLKQMQSGWKGEEVTENEWIGVKPSVNQVDVHPFMTRDDIVNFCRKHDIVLEVRAAHRIRSTTLTDIDWARPGHLSYAPSDSTTQC